MLREFLSRTSLFDLPVVAMLLFLAIFAVVLLRVARRGAAAEYRRMSTMPLLDDDHMDERGHMDQRDHTDERTER